MSADLPSYRAGAIGSEPRWQRLQAHIFSQRNLLAALPVAVALVLAPTPRSVHRFALGLALVALGVALRAASTTHNRYAQGERKTLATKGPYAWSRNPLYLGNGLVLLGAACVAGPLWLVPLTAVWAAGVYDQVARHEERRLLRKYGASYETYRAVVPRWLPAPGRWLRLRTSAFPRACIAQSRGLLLLLPFAVKAWLL